MSLLVETMWSDRDWFLKRTPSEDVAASIRPNLELRRAADLLLSQPEADASRFAYVGHDVSAMYGILIGSVDLRPSCYVLMAGTPRFSDWCLYSPRPSDESQRDYIRWMEPLDPVGRVASLEPAPLLFQFGREDPHVPKAQAKRFVDAAGAPKDVRWHDGRHALNDAAARDRQPLVAASPGDLVACEHDPLRANGVRRCQGECCSALLRAQAGAA